MSVDLNDIERRMEGAVATLKTELNGLRTGRASANLLEPIMVEAYGQQMPLAQVGTISVPEPRMLSVQVWDKGQVAAVEKGDTRKRAWPQSDAGRSDCADTVAGAE